MSNLFDQEKHKRYMKIIENECFGWRPLKEMPACSSLIFAEIIDKYGRDWIDKLSLEEIRKIIYDMINNEFAINCFLEDVKIIKKIKEKTNE